MRNISRAVLAGIAAAFICVEAGAIVPEHNSRTFDSIPNRNVFGLKPPPQNTISNTPPVVPKLILQGITTILGNKRVLLKEEPPAQPGAKPAAPGKELSMILTEGQREGSVEVLEIDENAGSVKVNNSGTIMTLTFEKDGPKLPSTPAPGNTSGIPVNLPGGNAAVYPARPGTAVGWPATNNANRTYQRRTPRWPMNGTAGAAAQGSQAPSPTGLPGAPTIPPPTANDIPSGLTPEEQAVVSQFQSRYGLQNANGAAPANNQFRTPPQEGIAPAFVPPPPNLPNRLLPQ